MPHGGWHNPRPTRLPDLLLIAGGPHEGLPPDECLRRLLRLARVRHAARAAARGRGSPLGGGLRNGHELKRIR